MLLQVVELGLQGGGLLGTAHELLLEGGILGLCYFQQGLDGREPGGEITDGGGGGSQLLTHGFQVGGHGSDTGCQRLNSRSLIQCFS